MKNAFATVFVLASMSYALSHSNGQDATNRIAAGESPFKDALIIVKPTQDSYRLGSPMPLSVTVTNISPADILVMPTLPERDDYRVSVFSADGTRVPGPPDIVHNGITSVGQLTITPGQSESRNLDLAKLTRIEAA